LGQSALRRALIAVPRQAGGDAAVALTCLMQSDKASIQKPITGLDQQRR